METVHDELYDAYITRVQYADSHLVLNLSRRTYSHEAGDLVDSQRSRLIFTGVLDLDAQKERGRTLFTRRPKFFNTARDLLKISETFPNLRTPIDEIQLAEKGFILRTHLSGEFYIQASGSSVEDWVTVVHLS